MWFYKGRRESSPPPSPTFSSSQGERIEKTTLPAGSLGEKLSCFCNIYIQNYASANNWHQAAPIQSVHLSRSFQPVANVHLQTQKDRGMALRLNEIHLPKIYRPTLKPKRKNAASTYSHCSLYGWLTSKGFFFFSAEKTQWFVTNLSAILVLLVSVKCRRHGG